MEENDNDYKAQISEELSNIPLGELRAIQAKLGLKAFQKIKEGTKGKTKTGDALKRLNKHRPAEFSSRRPVPKDAYLRKEKTQRDPRFDDLSGEFKPKLFESSYGFIDEMKLKERKMLEDMIEETEDKEEREKIKDLYQRMNQKEMAKQRKEKQLQLEKEWKTEEKEKIQKGKKPFYLKDSEKKARLKEEHEKELQKSGKVDKYIRRKNKKLAALEKKSQTWKTDEV